MITTPFVLISLFLCGAALSLMAAAAGALLSLWCAHVARTGCNPMPSMAKLRLFKRKTDEDEDANSNGQHQARQQRVGP